MYCPNCGNPLENAANFCTKCGSPVNNNNYQMPIQNEEEINVWLVLLAVFVPLFGFIYWPMEYKTKPRTAKACGIAAIISFALSFIFSIAMVSLITNFFFDFANLF